MLKGTYFPAHEENRMAHEGDVEGARQRFLQERPRSLTCLLRQRYSWMNDYLLGRIAVIELGMGTRSVTSFSIIPHLALTAVGGHFVEPEQTC